MRATVRNLIEKRLEWTDVSSSVVGKRIEDESSGNSAENANRGESSCSIRFGLIRARERMIDFFFIIADATVRGDLTSRQIGAREARSNLCL